MLPPPGTLRSWISPPSRLESSRLIARPRPVPPYFRLVLASACWNASKMIFCFSSGMPMPVSETSKATTVGAWRKVGCSGLHPPVAAEMLRRTPPWAVNLKAFDSRFLSTCCRRLESVIMLRSRFGSTCTSKDRRRLSASWRNGRTTMSCKLLKKTSSASTETVPDSILERSRMSLIRLSRSVPAPWIVRANSTCLGLKLPSGLSPSCWPRIRMLFSGVRSSCDMLARNSDLYFEVSASSVALPSRARRACSISWFLRSTSTLRSASCCAFCSTCSLVCCSSCR